MAFLLYQNLIFWFAIYISCLLLEIFYSLAQLNHISEHFLVLDFQSFKHQGLWFLVCWRWIRLIWLDWLCIFLLIFHHIMLIHFIDESHLRRLQRIIWLLIGWGDMFWKHAFVLNGQNFLPWVLCTERNVLDWVGFRKLSFNQFPVLLQLQFLVLQLKCNLDFSHRFGFLHIRVITFEFIVRLQFDTIKSIQRFFSRRINRRLLLYLIESAFIP